MLVRVFQRLFPASLNMTVHTRRPLGLIAAIAMACAAPSAPADIASVDGAAVVYTDIPTNIKNGQWTSDTEIRVWFERRVTLADDLFLSHVNPGLVDASALLVSGTLPSGTTVQSYMIRLDPATGSPLTLSGSVTFDTQILGVIINPHLGSTDGILGRPGVTYNTNGNRGLELDDGTADSFEISADRLTISFTMFVQHGPTDDIRVVTAAPESCVADLNGDNFVNGDDYDLFAEGFELGDLGADLNLDGFVNGDDYDLFAEHFEAGC